MLNHVNPSGVDRAAQLIRNSQRILVLTGAGISTSCGIPDFRSHDGLYALVQAGDLANSQDVVTEPGAPEQGAAVDGRTDDSAALRRSSRSRKRGSTANFAELTYHVDDPQDIMNINVFRSHPQVFYNHAYRLLPSSDVEPSPTHTWIKRLEEDGKLLRQYTQNIDGLETKAGIHTVFHCHGSLTTSTCISCKHRVETATLRETIMAKQVPRCARCSARTATGPTKKRKTERVVGLYKPDITFFHEPVPRAFHLRLARDIPRADLLIVIGTSLLIPPVKDIPGQMSGVPKILINRDGVRGLDDALFLQGDCDAIVKELESRRNGSDDPD
ncbi:NAD-dependent histone deacetylase sir2 [Naganishia albida]|nr:NAD-dependent histone deacetylase sir2 [Naganishia albida]